MFSLVQVRRGAEWVLLTLLFAVVLWKGGKTLDSVWALGGATALLACTYALATRRTPSSLLRPRAEDWFFVLFVLLSILSFYFSETKNYGLEEILATITLCLLFLISPSLSSEFRRRFFTALSIGLLLSCVVGILIYVLQPVNRFVGTFFDYRFHTDYWPNAWGEFVLFGWPVLFYQLFLRDADPDDVRLDFLRAASLGLVFGALLLSYSRGSVLVLLLQLALLLFASVLLWKHILPWKRVGTVSVTVLLTASIVFLGVNHVRSQFHSIESVVKKVTFTSAEGASSVSERTQFFLQALQLTRDKPFLGHGPYSFRFIQPHLQTEILATSDHPHNVLLKFALERGVPAALIFLLLLTLVFFRGVRSLFLPSATGEHRGAVLVLLLASFGVLAHNLIDFNLQFVAIVAPLTIALGLLSSEIPRASATPRLWKVFVGASAILLLFTLFFEGKNLTHSSLARRAERRGDDAAAFAYYRHAVPTLFPRDALLSQGAMQLNAGNFRSAEDAVVSYLESNGEDARAWRLLGDIYAAWKKNSDAIRAYEKAFDYGRENDAGIVRGYVSVLRKNPERLKAQHDEIDRLLSDYADAIESNTHFIALSRGVEDVIDTCELLARAFPRDATRYQGIATSVREHARLERERYSSRPRGVLW